MSEWISIDDHLPEDDGKYLVASISFCVQVRFYANERVDKFFGDIDATHWMPLPEPPK